MLPQGTDDQRRKATDGIPPLPDYRPGRVFILAGFIIAQTAEKRQYPPVSRFLPEGIAFFRKTVYNKPKRASAQIY
jgi:hypothetical protein